MNDAEAIRDGVAKAFSGFADAFLSENIHNGVKDAFFTFDDDWLEAIIYRGVRDAVAAHLEDHPLKGRKP
jgi:hypothetical protein